MSKDDQDVQKLVFCLLVYMYVSLFLCVVWSLKLVEVTLVS